MNTQVPGESVLSPTCLLCQRWVRVRSYCFRHCVNRLCLEGTARRSARFPLFRWYRTLCQPDRRLLRHSSARHDHAKRSLHCWRERSSNCLVQNPDRIGLRISRNLAMDDYLRNVEEREIELESRRSFFGGRLTNERDFPVPSERRSIYRKR